MTKQGDMDLVRRSAAGDQPAFAELVRRHEAPLASLLRYRVGPDHAEDVLQETLLAAWRDLRQVRDGTRIRPWLMQVARNQALAFHRSTHRRDVPTESVALERLVTRWGDDEASRLETTRRARDVIKEAPAADRSILRLFYVEGLTIAEIAARHRQPSGTVKRRLHTVRQSLRQTMNITPTPRNTTMTDALSPFPLQRPKIDITPSDGEFALDCRELRWWHIVPEIGSSARYATYHAPDWHLTKTTSAHATGPSRVHGQDCVRIDVSERDASGTAHDSLTMYGRLADNEAQWLAVVARHGQREDIFTYLDEGWESQWGGHLPRRLADTGAFVDHGSGEVASAKPPMAGGVLEGGAGVFDVTVGDRRFRCLRILHLDLDLGDEATGDDQGLLIEAYLTEDGRTLLCRRYNGRLRPRTDAPWDQRFPNSPRMIVDGMTYVLWYEDLLDRAMETPS